MRDFDIDPGLAAPRVVRAADGVGLHVSDWGAGRPLVFLSSLGLPGGMWDAQRLALSRRGLRCLALDRRGHGRSGVPDGAYDYDTLADDLAAVLEDLDLDDAVLVGHSMAAGEMVRYASRYGARRLRGLVFVAPAGTPSFLRSAHAPDAPDAETFFPYLDAMVADFPGWIEANRAGFFAPDTPLATQDHLVRMMLTTPLKAIFECNRTLAGADFAGELRGIGLPGLVIGGEQDVSSPLALARATAALLPDATFRAYEGAPHGLFLTHAERLTDDIFSFVAGLETGASGRLPAREAISV